MQRGLGQQCGEMAKEVGQREPEKALFGAVAIGFGLHFGSAQVKAVASATGASTSV